MEALYTPLDFPISFMFKLAAIKTVSEKFHQRGHYRFAALPLNHLDGMIVGVRMIFYKNFAYDTDLWFNLAGPLYRLKIPDHPLGRLAVSKITRMLHNILYFGDPFIKQRICLALISFVGSGGEQQLLQQISQRNGKEQTHSQSRRKTEPRIFFQTGEVE